uniref:Uncharacterized protein n=1 Tax=Arundo donax TaxID=35708 RepID=A0A0A8XV45_ARUDO
MSSSLVRSLAYQSSIYQEMELLVLTLVLSIIIQQIANPNLLKHRTSFTLALKWMIIVGS